jgi:hypothetical protein
VGVTGTEHIGGSSVNHSISEIGAANSGAFSLDSSLSDPLLASVLASWSKLSPADRAIIAASVQAALDRSVIAYVGYAIGPDDRISGTQSHSSAAQHKEGQSCVSVLRVATGR